MTKAKFPRISNDGTFCVEVVLGIPADHDDNLAVHVQQWINAAWAPTHSTWTRLWRTEAGSVVIEEILRYEDDFLEPPEILSGEGSELHIRLHVKGSSSWWRDWFVSRLIPDLKERFPEVGGLVRLGNCDPPHSWSDRRS